jgi:hypothetical protein
MKSPAKCRQSVPASACEVTFMTSKKRPAVPRIKKVSRPADETVISDAVLPEVIEQVLKNVTVNRSYDVPYLGGSSRSGTIYIDRRLPRSFQSRGRRVSPDPFIVLHEAVERAVGDRLKLKYQHAHQIALRVEEAAVRAAGVLWNDYNDFTRKWEDAAQKSFSRLPPDLDLKPYRDEKDTETLRRIARARRA